MKTRLKSKCKELETAKAQLAYLKKMIHESIDDNPQNADKQPKWDTSQMKKEWDELQTKNDNLIKQTAEIQQNINSCNYNQTTFSSASYNNYNYHQNRSNHGNSSALDYTVTTTAFCNVNNIDQINDIQ